MESTEFVPFDLDTGSVDRLFTSEPGTFIKLVGVGDDIEETAPWSTTQS